jgi:hypothetical protein
VGVLTLGVIGLILRPEKDRQPGSTEGWFLLRVDSLLLYFSYLSKFHIHQWASVARVFTLPKFKCVCVLLYILLKFALAEHQLELSCHADALTELRPFP